jgi:ELWxxDGT repeat protein
MIKNANITNVDAALGILTTIGNRIYYIGKVSSNKLGLFESDGTNAGTNLIADPNPGFGIYSVNNAIANGKLFFAGNDSIIGVELYKLELPKYTVTVLSGANGSISTASPNPVLIGSDINFTITPNTGYSIDSVWIDNVLISNTNTYTFYNVSKNHIIKAKFKSNASSFSITASSSTGGTITPAGVSTVNVGSSITYTISANAGYILDSLLIDNASIALTNSYTFTNVSETHTIRAVFKQNQNSIHSSKKESFEVFPNPASTSIHIISNKNDRFILFNAKGEEIKLGIETNGETNISSLSNGIYYLKNRNTEELKRIIKE